ncbi:hypothetical protein K469DRAFT_764302 [Zopfia rhizophila CBS 207.26]|uniref:Uncharacterized protein n=1 Tax=Zopfia rhizophila CBS 207.26 TaxID=1314779 RepID=A0A6A6EGJ3_9PEZI|nr:hypothetical protein K469DRAFT_764302 [Zopfia rhizophila CBS 207.26]
MALASPLAPLHAHLVALMQIESTLSQPEIYQLANNLSFYLHYRCGCGPKFVETPSDINIVLVQSLGEFAMAVVHQCKTVIASSLVSRRKDALGALRRELENRVRVTIEDDGVCASELDYDDTEGEEVEDDKEEVSKAKVGKTKVDNAEGEKAKGGKTEVDK